MSGSGDGIRVVIVDDEPVVRRGLRSALARHSDVTIVGECEDGPSAVETILAEGPDAAFLDIRMPGLTGLEVVEAIPRAQRPLIVFVTAFDEHAVRAFDLNAIDYLLKPYDDERIDATIQRLRERLGAGERGAGEQRMDEVIRQVRASPYPERILAVTVGRMRVIPMADVVWFEAADNYVRVHAGERSGLVRETMASLEQRLDPALFARVHRSAIVNLLQIDELRPRTNGDYELVLRNGTRLTASRSYSAAILKRLESGDVTPPAS